MIAATRGLLGFVREVHQVVAILERIGIALRSIRHGGRGIFRVDRPLAERSRLRHAIVG
jgi:hypothetical protein